jgi:glycosyltransferase involved in cell wall biosynthesis
MRVMHMINAMHRGGAESVVLEHVRHSGSDVETWVCAINGGGEALDQAAKMGAHTSVLDKSGGWFATFPRLARLLREARIEVVNGHNPSGAFHATLAGRMAGVPAIVRTEHSIHFAGRASWAYEPVLEPVLTTLAQRVICVSNAVRESHAGRLRALAARFVTIPNGISDARPSRSRAEIRASLGAAETDRLVLTVGGLNPQKAQLILIDAFASLAREIPSARLWIAGEGVERPKLEARIAERGLGAQARLLGMRGDIPDLIEACDLFVLSSVREGLSMALLEAMRGSRAVVATRVGGNAEVVVEGEQGHIVPPGDAPALAGAMRDVLADPVRARAMGESGRKRWLEGFTAERMLRRTEELYREQLARAGRGAGS